MDQSLEEIDNNKYTDEQKIVAAVWVHERHYNHQSWETICNNFKIRFNASPPMRTTFMSWEKKLFHSGTVKNKDKSGRPLARLMHVPYVKASLKESPYLSLRERARELGLPRTTLLKILQEDLNMEFEITIDESNPNRKHAMNNSGVWKKNVKDTLSASESESGTCDQKVVGNTEECDVKPNILKLPMGTFINEEIKLENDNSNSDESFGD